MTMGDEVVLEVGRNPVDAVEREKTGCRRAETIGTRRTGAQHSGSGHRNVTWHER